MKRLLLFSILFLPIFAIGIFAQATMSGVMINEISSMTIPGDGIELYNPTGAAVNVGGWEIYDNTTLRATIPAGTMIPPGGFLVINYSGLNNTGDQVLVYDPVADTYIGATYDNGSAAVINPTVLPTGTATSLGTESFGTGGSSSGNTYQRDPDGSTTFVVKAHTMGGTNLPVELIYFKGKINEQTINLNWATATEIDNDYFQVEHSTNGINFDIVEKIQGAGTSISIKEYNFIHETPSNSANYYRLKQVDFDGAFEYSKVVSLFFKGDDEWFLHPTLTGDQITIQWSENIQPEAISIFSLTGKMVFDKKINIENSVEEIDVQHLPKGHYFLKLKSGRSISTKRFIKI